MDGEERKLVLTMTSYACKYLHGGSCKRQGSILYWSGGINTETVFCSSLHSGMTCTNYTLYYRCYTIYQPNSHTILNFYERLISISNFCLVHHKVHLSLGRTQFANFTIWHHICEIITNNVMLGALVSHLEQK